MLCLTSVVSSGQPDSRHPSRLLLLLRTGSRPTAATIGRSIVFVAGVSIPFSVCVKACSRRSASGREPDGGDSSSELWVDVLCVEWPFGSDGWNSDLIDQSETARSSKLRIVSRHPVALLLLILDSILLIPRPALLFGAGGTDPA